MKISSLHSFWGTEEPQYPWLCFADGDEDEGGEGGGSGDETPPPGIKPLTGDEKSLLDTQGSEDEGGDDDAPDGDGTGDDDDGASQDTEKLIFKEKPDWLAENFWDEKTGEVRVKELQKSQKDLRTRMARGEDKTPEDVDGYTLELNPETDADLIALEARVYADVSKEEDPLVNWFKGKAVEHKLPVETVNDMYRGFMEIRGELIPEPIDYSKEVSKMGRGGPAIVKGITDFHANLINKGVLSETEGAHVSSWLQTAEDIVAFQKIRDYYGEAAPPASAVIPDGTPSRLELRAKMGEVTNQVEYDKLMVEYEKLYGKDDAGSSQNERFS